MPTVPASALPAHAPDLANGKYMFTVGGCAECHAVPLKKCDDLKTKEKDVLAGGRCLKTPFGVFHVPNISPDKETGIGNWTTVDFVNAMKHGIGPGGEHLYPAFPYSSYQRMTYEDLIDLKAYLDTLPAVKNEVPPHELSFPFNIRRGLGFTELGNYRDFLTRQIVVEGAEKIAEGKTGEKENENARGTVQGAPASDILSRTAIKLVVK